LLLQELGDRVEGGRAPVTPHGFLRSIFRDWAGETTAYPREVIEAALVHARGDQTKVVYARGDLFLKRRALMDDWAAFLDHVPATVTAAIQQRTGFGPFGAVGEKPAPPSDHEGPDRVPGDVIVDLQMAILEEGDQQRPLAEGVVDGFADATTESAR
jgi:hypothetical protein